MVVPGSPDGGGQRQKFVVKPDLLDFLFTLALTIGLAPELLGKDGMLSRNWVLAIPPPSFVFDISVFLLGIVTLLFSWYGFNASVEDKPVLYGSVAGLLRFSIDAFLVVLYGFLLLQFDNFGVFVLTLTIIFFLYVIWDILKLLEYRRPPFNKKRLTHDDDWVRQLFGKLEEKRSASYFLVHVVLLAVYQVSNMWDFYVGLLNVMILILLYVATFRYRAEKVNWRIGGKRHVIDKITENS